MWKFCGWALNGSYVKVAVPSPPTQSTPESAFTEDLDGGDDDDRREDLTQVARLSDVLLGSVSAKQLVRGEDHWRSRRLASQTTDCIASLLLATRHHSESRLQVPPFQIVGCFCPPSFFHMGRCLSLPFLVP